jgi:DNA-binding XRE family transcriptional regulator
MKMKDQLDSAQPMKKHKAKIKKTDLKKKKRAKLEAKKQSKDKKQIKAVTLPTSVVKAQETKEPITAQTKAPTTVPLVVNTESSVTNVTDTQTARTRASKSLTPMTKAQQRVAINKIIKSLILDEITQGAALRELRVNVLGLRQEAYTELTGVSRKTLSEIENDKGNYTPEIINKVFKPFDLKVGLIPISSSVLKTLLR